MKQYFSEHINFLFQLFEKANRNIVLLMDTDGIILKVSSSFTRTFIYEPDDVLGKHFSFLFTEEDRRLYKPQKEISRVLHDGRADDNNYVIDKRGNKLWVSGESLFLNDEENNYILKILQNIQIQKTTETEAVILKDFNENILSSIDDSILVLDKNQKIIKYNESFRLLFQDGVPKDLSFRKLLDLVTFDDERYELEHKINQVIRNGLSFKNYSVELSFAGLEKRVFEVGGQPLVDKSAGETILLIIHDITNVRKLEKEREDVLGFVAHELRNPLSNLILCNELISEAIEDPDMSTAKTMLVKSKENLGRLNKMIGELYRSTQIHGNQMILETNEFNIDEIVQETVDTALYEHPEFNIKISGSVHRKLKGDKFKLIQVLSNYLNNAIKYSNGNYEVTVQVKIKKEALVIAVNDHGLGIPLDQQSYIFDRFFRTEKTRDFEGIGLGLYLCKRIINAHHGRVWVKSEEGKGSTFYFSVPLQ